MKRTMLLSCALLGALLVAAPAGAQVSVPNTFSSGTPAVASEVNANFAALVAAMNSAASSQQNRVTTSYGMPYASTDALSSRNVSLMRTINFDGTYHYFMFIYYTGSASSQVLTDGTPTTYTYIEEYCHVNADTGGVIVTSANCSRRGTNDPRGAGRTYAVEQVTYNTDGSVAATTNTLAKYVDVQTGTSYFNVINPRLRRQFIAYADADYATISDLSYVLLKNPASITINGLVFSDTVFRMEAGVPRIWIQAAGIGPVVFGTDKVIYYRIQGGATGGSLTGTPFAGAGTFTGILF